MNHEETGREGERERELWITCLIREFLLDDDIECMIMDTLSLADAYGQR